MRIIVQILIKRVAAAKKVTTLHHRQVLANIFLKLMVSLLHCSTAYAIPQVLFMVLA